MDYKNIDTDGYLKGLYYLSVSDSEDHSLENKNLRRYYIVENSFTGNTILDCPSYKRLFNVIKVGNFVEKKGENVKLCIDDLCSEDIHISNIHAANKKEIENSYKRTLDSMKIMPDGEYKELYPNGQLKLRTFYKNGEINGEYKEWYPNGQLKLHTFYKNGKINGKFISYKGNYIFEEINFKNGHRDGVYRKFYSRGKKHIETFFIKDVLDGEYKKWSATGELIENGMFKQGKKTGKWKRKNIEELY